MICSSYVLCSTPHNSTILSTSILLRCMTIYSHMICPFCNNKTRIYNSRSTHAKTQTWRRHRCISCTRTFTTREKIDWSGATTVTDPDGSSQYSRERLLLSLARASSKLTLPPEMLAELCDSIELELQQSGFFTDRDQPSELITQSATLVLKRYNPHLALQYVNIVYRNQPPLELIKQLVNA